METIDSIKKKLKNKPTDNLVEITGKTIQFVENSDYSLTIGLQNGRFIQFLMSADHEDVVNDVKLYIRNQDSYGINEKLDMEHLFGYITDEKYDELREQVNKIKLSQEVEELKTDLKKKEDMLK